MLFSGPLPSSPSVSPGMCSAFLNSKSRPLPASFGSQAHEVPLGPQDKAAGFNGRPLVSNTGYLPTLLPTGEAVMVQWFCASVIQSSHIYQGVIPTSSPSLPTRNGKGFNNSPSVQMVPVLFPGHRQNSHPWDLSPSL